MYLTFSNLNSIHLLIKKKMYFSGLFMTIFRSNYFHLKLSFFKFFKIFVTYMLMYLRFSNLNSIHWIIKKIQAFMYFSGHFMTIFRSNYFHLKLSFFNLFLNIRYIYPNVFTIFKFELNLMDNKKIQAFITFQDIFRTFHDNFQVKLFPPKITFFLFFLKYLLNIC